MIRKKSSHSLKNGDTFTAKRKIQPLPISLLFSSRVGASPETIRRGNPQSSEDSHFLHFFGSSPNPTVHDASAYCPKGLIPALCHSIPHPMKSRFGDSVFAIFVEGVLDTHNF